MLELNFLIKIFSVVCIQLLLLIFIQKLNLKKYFSQYQGIQKIHDGEILRIGSLFLFLPLIIAVSIALGIFFGTSLNYQKKTIHGP